MEQLHLPTQTVLAYRHELFLSCPCSCRYMHNNYILYHMLEILM